MSDAIARLNTALEGRYAIERGLGEGGMATVYLAKDLRHNRNVALKVLKPELAAVLGGERFLTEITTTANLQHPHILPLFDSGEADSLFGVGRPEVLFEGDFWLSGVNGTAGPDQSYDVTADGRFVMIRQNTADGTDLRVVRDFLGELRERLGN
jgi:serine/threonine protein kinase